jgi:hypothetical protein
MSSDDSDDSSYASSTQQTKRRKTAHRARSPPEIEECKLFRRAALASDGFLEQLERLYSGL